MRHKSVCTWHHTRVLVCARDASFARSFDPCTSILTMHQGAIPGGGAFEVASRLGKPAQVGETFTGAIANGRSAARRVSEVPQGIAPGTEEKEGGRGLRPCEDPKSSGLVARTSIVVAEVGRRRLASNKLGKRAPKRAAGSSEQGSSSSLSSLGETSGGDVGRNGQSHVGLHRHSGRGPAPGSGWREIAIQRSQHRQKR
jgi:hypothetical protein